MMHLEGISAFDEDRLITVPSEKVVEFLMADASQDAWVGDLITIQMEDRQYRAISGGVEKFIGVPACRKRACFRFAVPNHCGHNQVGIIIRGAERMT